MPAIYQVTYDGFWFPSVHVELDMRLSWTYGARFALADEATVRVVDKEAISVMEIKGLGTAAVAASVRVRCGGNYVEGPWGEIKKLLSNPSGTLPPPSLKNGFPIEVIEECWRFPSPLTSRRFATLEKINSVISEWLDLKEKGRESEREHKKCTV